jgi:hypothetical protein
MKLLTLEEWSEKTYEGKRPTLQTLQRWARNGNLYPAPQKHGKEYRVREDAIYINPGDYGISRQIIRNNPGFNTGIVRRIKDGKTARKV